jgi:hypothetical protein
MTWIGVLALVIAAYAGWRGLRRMRRGLRESASLELVRGIRALVTAAAVGVGALALLTGERGLLAFAAVFLAEELYETGVLALIIRASGEAGPARATP